MMGNKIDYKKNEWTYSNVKGFSFNEILDLANGGLKFLKVEPHASYPEHVHVDKVEYAVVIEGTPTISVNENVFIAKAGDVFVFEPKNKHAIANKSNEISVLLIGNISKKE